MTYTQRDVKNNMGLVYMVARKMRHLVNGFVEFEDLVGDGTLGLIYALERFDPERGFQFSSFAVRYIRGYVLRGQRNLFRDHWRAKESKTPSGTTSIYKEASLGLIPGLGDRGCASRELEDQAHAGAVWRRLWPDLSPKQREVIALMRLGLQQCEIAGRSGTSRSAVTNAYMKASRKARKLYPHGVYSHTEEARTGHAS